MNIHDGAFFFAKTVFSNFKTFKVEKNSSTHEPDMNWLKIGEKDALCGFILFSVAVAAIYFISPSHVEFFVHTWFHRVSKFRSCSPDKRASTLIRGS